MIKKSLILLLGSLFLVASCDSSSTNDRPSVDNTSSSTTLDNSNTISNSTSSEDSVSSNTSSSVSTLNEYQTPDGFVSSFSAGYNFDVTDGSDEKLTKALDPNGQFISSVSFSGLFVQEHVMENSQSCLELTLGSKKLSGSLTINTKTNFQKVKFVVQAYSKYVEFNTSYTKDESAKIYVNDNSNYFDLSISTEGENPLHEFVSEVESTNTVTISNDDVAHRVFIKSIVFYY